MLVWVDERNGYADDADFLDTRGLEIRILLVMAIETDVNVLDAARGFVPMLRERADDIEMARQLPQDISDLFADAGLYGMFVPRKYGGSETSPVAFMDVVEALATGDGSAAWCVFIGATSGLVSGYLPPATAQEIFGANPRSRIAGVFAPRGFAVPENGSYRVNGEWQWGSGTQNSDWVLGGCAIIRDGSPELLPNGMPASRMMITPRSEIEFLDTWHVSGLSGTGSTNFAMRDLLIPADRAVSLMVDKPINRPLWAFPVFGLLAIGISAVALGLARAAVDEVVDLASKKTPEGRLKPLAKSAITHRDVAEAEALIRSGRAFLWDSISRAYDAAMETGELSVELRRDIRLAAANATRSGAKAVDIAYNLAGGSSVYRTSPIQRYFRDVHVATQHMMIGPMIWEQTGRLFVGVDSDTSML